MALAPGDRIASIFLKQTAELRKQAEKEGALAYLREHAVRGLPNSRSLTANVLGIQQGKEMHIAERIRLRKAQGLQLLFSYGNPRAKQHINIPKQPVTRSHEVQPPTTGSSLIGAALRRGWNLIRGLLRWLGNWLLYQIITIVIWFVILQVILVIYMHDIQAFLLRKVDDIFESIKSKDN